MAMTDRERVLAFLRSVSPGGATNSEMQEATGVEGNHHNQCAGQPATASPGARGGSAWSASPGATWRSGSQNLAIRRPLR